MRAELAAGAAQVWTVDLDQPAWRVASLADVLDADERARAAAFVRERDRLRFTVAHAVLRDVLSRYAGASPAALRFVHGASGKPALAGGGPHFSLSHGGGFGLVGVAADRPVGVDVERVSGHIDVDAVARRYFSARELDLLLSLEPRERRRCFFRLWTCKEACVKADGRGIGALQGVAIDLEAGRAPRTRGYGLAELEPAPGYVAALAVPGSAAPPVTVLRWIHNNACSDRVLGRVA